MDIEQEITDAIAEELRSWQLGTTASVHWDTDPPTVVRGNGGFDMAGQLAGAVFTRQTSLGVIQ